MKLQPHSNTCQASSGEACICGAGQLNYVILLQDRNEKLEKVVKASQCRNSGNDFKGNYTKYCRECDYCKAIAELEQP